jgi:hypothetical protein
MNMHLGAPRRIPKGVFLHLGGRRVPAGGVAVGRILGIAVLVMVVIFLIKSYRRAKV